MMISYAPRLVIYSYHDVIECWQDTMIEKLRLKNTSLRAKCKKLILHLKQVSVLIFQLFDY